MGLWIALKIALRCDQNTSRRAPPDFLMTSDLNMTEAPDLKAWDEEELKPGARVFFQAMHPRYGRAEFEFCHVFKRGKLQTVFIYPRQQEVASIYYRVDCFGRSEFCIGSWTHQDVSNPRVWQQYYCREHKGFVLRVYVPPEATYFDVGYGEVHFGRLVSND